MSDLNHQENSTGVQESEERKDSPIPSVETDADEPQPCEETNQQPKDNETKPATETSNLVKGKSRALDSPNENAEFPTEVRTRKLSEPFRPQPVRKTSIIKLPGNFDPNARSRKMSEGNLGASRQRKISFVTSVGH